MRTSGKTKRELAVEAAILGMIGAQVRCEAESNVVTEQEGDELQAIGRRLEEMAESMYAQSQPGAGRLLFSLDVQRRLDRWLRG